MNWRIILNEDNQLNEKAKLYLGASYWMLNRSLKKIYHFVALSSPSTDDLSSKNIGLGID